MGFYENPFRIETGSFVRSPIAREKSRKLARHFELPMKLPTAEVFRNFPEVVFSSRHDR